MERGKGFNGITDDFQAIWLFAHWLNTGSSVHKSIQLELKLLSNVGCVVLVLILLVLTGSYAGLWALRFVLEQRPDTE